MLIPGFFFSVKPEESPPQTILHDFLGGFRSWIGHRFASRFQKQILPLKPAAELAQLEWHSSQIHPQSDRTDRKFYIGNFSVLKDLRYITVCSGNRS